MVGQRKKTKTIFDQLVVVHDQIQRAWTNLYDAIERQKTPKPQLPEKTQEK